MLLPDDNSIVLPVDNDSFVADGSEMPAATIDDVRALLPGYAQEGDDTPMRAGVLQGFRGLANMLWARVGLVLNAQRSPRHAAGAMLDWWGPFFKRFRAADEPDPQYRQRLLSPTQMVTPASIRSAVDAQVARFTLQKATYQEPVLGDAMYMGPATVADPPKPHATITSNVVPPWQAFIQPTVGRLWAHYPDKPTAKTGAYLVPIGGGRLWVTLPGTPGDATTAPHTMPPGLSANWSGPMDFIQGIAGVSGPHQSVVAGAPFGGYAGFLPRAATSLIDAVCSEIEQRKADGVAAAILFDPYFLVGL